jgi:hypothetical protein
MPGTVVNRPIGRMPAANEVEAGVIMHRIDHRNLSRPKRLASTRYSPIPV